MFQIGVMLYHSLAIVCLWFVFTCGVPVEESSPRCTYENCPAITPEKINVHIISHTHDDVGWLKTVDQYYYGNRNGIQNAGVQYILDSVIDALQRDAKRRFIYVESAFFWRWWEQQTDSIQHIVRKLVREGRLEFIGGGWSMNDEGAAHYNAIIDNMALGLKVLNDTFGVCGRPKVAWQIDPFGHSREQASIFAQMGYDGLFFGRLDYRDFRNRKIKKEMEVVWQGSDNLGSKADLFTGVLPNLYQPPSGFCFDILCQDAPVMDDPRLEDYNVPQKVDLFMRHVRNQASWYKTKNIVMTMGNDFNYQNAHTWFKNLDKVIYHVNKMEPNVSVFYSTPSCYLNSLHKADIEWKVKKQDFMPYASEPHAYWVGYYTSRPTFKRYIRSSNNFLQVCKQLETIAHLGQTNRLHTDVLRRAMAVVQHHDAVTGTAKQHVTNDYYKRLYIGNEACQITVSSAYKKLMADENANPPPVVHNYCNLLNISECHFTETQSQFAVTIYNPIGRQLSRNVRFPVKYSEYQVTDSNGKTTTSQVVPIPNEVQNVPGRKSTAEGELVFQSKLPALGYTTYYIKAANQKSVGGSRNEELSGRDFSIGNDAISITFDGNNGLVKQMKNMEDASKIYVNQTFQYYRGMAGFNKNINDRASGAYIFRPNSSHPVSISEKVEVRIIRGPVVEEVHQKFNSWVSQVIRIYKNELHAEFEWLVGSIPIHTIYDVGKEVISRFESNINSKDEYYTDSNGREMLQRLRNKRPDYDVSPAQEPVAINYFPVNSRIFVKDENVQLTVSTDRSQAGASLFSGSVELMVHRRLLYDDGFGVEEALNEKAFGKGLVARGIHYVQLSNVNKAAFLHRVLGEEVFMAPSLSFSSLTSESSFKKQFSGLKMPLPPNVHLLTLEHWTDDTLLLRLEHFFEKTDDPSSLSKPVTISLADMFTTFRVVSATEMSLDGVHKLSAMKRLKWKTEGRPNPEVNQATSVDFDLQKVILEPMEIRTFILKISQ